MFIEISKLFKRSNCDFYWVIFIECISELSGYDNLELDEFFLFLTGVLDKWDIGEVLSARWIEVLPIYPSSSFILEISDSFLLLCDSVNS